MKRERADIKAEILELCKEPHTMTEILAKKCYFGGYYVSHIKDLLSKGLLKAEGKSKVGRKYQTTEKGLLWLKTYRQLKQIEEETRANLP